MTRLFSLSARFCRDKRGVAAVEAGLLFPLLIVMLLGLVETTLALDSRRAVQNASFSMVQAAAATDVVDADTRQRMQRGLELALEAGSFSNVSADLVSLVRARDGSFNQDWSWNPSNNPTTVPLSRLLSSFDGTTRNTEGILVAVVEGRYRPVVPFAPTQQLTFDGVFSQVPIKKTIALFR